MQKLINFINWSTKIYHNETAPDETPSPLTIQADRKSEPADEATRPTSRIGKRHPSDFYRAIDMSG